mmetsp:Transcript_37683/g.43044  ORF Transcript_37683/g.43044 Transcript_37683/m.43044 type:complete len:369 (+) Transcript_37683:214-1320(+)
MMNSNQLRKRNFPLDRTVGAAVTFGMAYIIIQFFSAYMRHRKERKGSWFQSIACKIKRIIDLSSYPEDRLTLEVMHSGACHCRSIVFKFFAPLHINVLDAKGRIGYPHARVIASNFQIVTGEDLLHMYYIQVPPDLSKREDPTNAAFSFCSRCGVHILHAPSSRSNYLDVNIDCLDFDDRRILKHTKEENNLSNGLPSLGQWEGKDDLLDEQSEIETSRLLMFNQTTGDSIDGSASAEHHHYPQERWITSTPQSFHPPPLWHPETPSTVAASSMESYQSIRIQSDIIEDGVISCDELDTSSSSLPVSFQESLANNKINSTPDISSQEPSHTSPMIRDQLKYYMSKHISSGRKSKTRSNERKRVIVEPK